MRKVLIIVAVLALLAIFFWVFKSDQEEYLKKSLLPSVSINKFLLTETYKGKKIWEIEAALAQIFKEKAELKEVKVKFFLEDGHFYIIKAHKGNIDLLTKNFTLLRNIVTSSKDLNLQTDLLNWDSQKELIYTNSPVKITQDKIIITGNGLKLWPSGEITEILENVRIVVENG